MDLLGTWDISWVNKALYYNNWEETGRERGYMQ
jgi:hypothetical protein